MEFAWPAFRPENTDDEIMMQISENVGTGEKIYVRGGNYTQASGVYVSDVKIHASTQPTRANPCVVTTAAVHGYATGDTVYIYDAGMTQLNDRHFVITVLSTTTFRLNDEDSSSHTAAAAGNLDKIKTDFKFTSGMVDGFFSIRQLIAADLSEWVGEKVMPHLDARMGDEFTGDQIHYAGNVYSLAQGSFETLGPTPPTHDKTADGPKGYYTDGSWIFYNRGTGVAKITAIAADGYSCTVDVIEPFPYACSTVNPSETSRLNLRFVGNPMPRWSEGAWNDVNGYPRAVTFFEDRLWFAGTNADPQTFWGSQTARYDNFERVSDDASSAVQFTLASEKINAIEWLAGEQALLVGTRGGEFVASGTNDTEAISASNISVRRQSTFGVKPSVQPRFVDSALLFVQRAGERLHQLSYSNESNRYVGPDLTALSDDILRPAAEQLEYQSAPFRQLWVRLTDGKLVTLTYVNDQDVLGWAQVDIGGTGVEVESVAVIPHPDGDQDQVWMIVKRTIDSGTKRYIEHMEKPFTPTTVYADAFFVDSGLTYDGSATTTITGLDHLEGQTVRVFADGVVQADKTVSVGSISITSASKVQVGLGYDAKLQTMRMGQRRDAGNGSGKSSCV